jgi:glutamate 5-kinase
MESTRIIVKLGTSTITAGSAKISYPGLIDLARQVSFLKQAGYEIVLISSGAIAAGREILAQKTLPRQIPAKQMLAAIGQSKLMGIYTQIFNMYDLMVGQVLLTKDDLLDRRRYLNARNTLNAMLAYNVIPIINENDTVATEEIRFGDNDNLSALVANVLEADLLILLTDQDGLYSGDPRSDPDARMIDEVSTEHIPDELWQAAGGSISGLGTGGMFTKLSAADLARKSGATVFIANGRTPDILLEIVNNRAKGTKFHPSNSTLESRKRYMLAGVQATTGILYIDQGAEKAIKKGGSLLPVGISKVAGDFERGDIVRVRSVKLKEIAIGISNYSSADLHKISGKNSSLIEDIIGFSYGDEVIHHNNMMLV